MYILLDNLDSINVITNFVNNSLRSLIKQKILNNLRTYNREKSDKYVDNNCKKF